MVRVQKGVKAQNPITRPAPKVIQRPFVIIVFITNKALEIISVIAIATALQIAVTAVCKNITQHETLNYSTIFF